MPAVVVFGFQALKHNKKYDQPLIIKIWKPPLMLAVSVFELQAIKTKEKNSFAIDNTKTETADNYRQFPYWNFCLLKTKNNAFSDEKFKY